MYALLLEISVYSFLIFLLYGNQLRSSRTKLMGHFWVTKSLCFKAILKCKAIDMRMFFLLLFSCKYSITHFEFYKHLESFWKWEFLELGNYFVSRLNVYLSCARDTYKIWACKRKETWEDFQKKRRRATARNTSACVRRLSRRIAWGVVRRWTGWDSFLAGYCSLDHTSNIYLQCCLLYISLKTSLRG